MSSALKEYDKEREVVRLNPISNGTVLDHLPIKTAPKIMQMLNLNFDEAVMAAINIDSKKKGKKDLIFIEGKKLSTKEVAKIGLIAEGSTWNIVKGKGVVKKSTIKMPEDLIGIVICNNPNCITNKEIIETKFTITHNKGKCYYCEREMEKEEIIKSLK
jgi:aspartate carbamoyltransferase regulatory subunit